MRKQQIREFYRFYYRLGQDQEELERELNRGTDKALEFLALIPSWGGLYSLPVGTLLAIYFEAVGLLDRVMELKDADKRASEYLRLIQELEAEESEELDNEFEKLDKDCKSNFLALLICITGNMEGLRMYSQTVSSLVLEAERSNDALFKAVSVDRAVVSNPVIARKIGKAQLMGDESFMQQLAKSITRTKPRRKPSLDDTRFLLEMIDEALGLESMTRGELIESISDDLELLPEGKDSLSALNKLIQKRNKIRGSENAV